ncbi:MAG TPA: hypothetical protein VGA40_04605 [Candidatus Acidoferrales bacterium]
MAAQPNIQGGARFFIGVLGLGLTAWAVYGMENGILQKVVAVLGGYFLIEGLIGFSVLVRVFGGNSKT